MDEWLLDALGIVALAYMIGDVAVQAVCGGIRLYKLKKGDKE